MSNDSKDKEKDKNTKLIMEYLEKNQSTLKRSSSILSPPESSQQQKKPNFQVSSTSQSLPMNTKEQDMQGDEPEATKLANAVQIAIKDAIALILCEIQLLRETVHSDYKKLHTDYTELKDSITSKSNEVAESLTKRIDTNTDRITQMMDKNKYLQRENA